MASFRSFLAQIKASRRETGDAATSGFEIRRWEAMVKQTEVKPESKGILYWMQRDCRAQDNWALIFAQRMAHKAQLPLYVCFFGKPTKEFYPTTRQYKFLIQGLETLRDELKELNIKFYLINDTPTVLPDIMKLNNLGALICEFNPLRKHGGYIEKIAGGLSKDTAFIEVDAHNVVPCRKASDKQELAARTLRRKLPDEFLVEFPEVTRHLFDGEDLNVETTGFDGLIEKNEIHFKEDPSNLPPITWAKPGYMEGMKMFHAFLESKLSRYHEERNDPSLDRQSNMSPWLHFGQISAQRLALEAKRTIQNESDDNLNAFLDELICRKELSDNFCLYNRNYDNFEGARGWAKQTLNDHRKDRRPNIYSRQQFAEGATHDPNWNAAQQQLIVEGKMHGYMRMYWCKKILEWTESPEVAIETALYLNDTYSLDGSDPNGFAGIMWSICGIHDIGFGEREIFGKIRYMVDYSLERKYDMVAYCSKYLKNFKKENKKTNNKRKR